MVVFPKWFRSWATQKQKPIIKRKTSVLWNRAFPQVTRFHLLKKVLVFPIFSVCINTETILLYRKIWVFFFFFLSLYSKILGLFETVVLGSSSGSTPEFFLIIVWFSTPFACHIWIKIPIKCDKTGMKARFSLAAPGSFLILASKSCCCCC